MKHGILLLALIAFMLHATALAEGALDDISVDLIGIQSDRAVFQITNNSKENFDYVRYEPTKSLVNAFVQTYKNGRWEKSGPFRCGTMTKEEATCYVSHTLQAKEQLLTSISLQGVSHHAGDVVRIQVYLTRGSRFLAFVSNSQVLK